MMDLRAKVGQRFAVGFTGTRVDDRLRHLVQTYKVGNVILFKANLESAEQATALCVEIQSLVRDATGEDAFITIDQEGGVVTRLPHDMVNVPGAMALAATGDPACARKAAVITAAELARVGINFDLAPVLDINANAQNPAIGVRSYGDTPDTVLRYALEAMRGYGEGGVLCAGKHFPGHGDTHLDSHLSLPSVDKPREALERVGLRPFREAVRAGIPAIMTTHILFPALEKAPLPATMSRTILTDILRGEMGFEGLILSDGMEMGAVREHFGTPRGCVLALGAGVDIVFVCHDADLMAESLRAVEAAYLDGTLSMHELDASVARILRAKEESRAAFLRAAEASQRGGYAAVEARRVENARLMRRTITLVEGQTLPPLGERPVFIGPLSYRSTIASTPSDTSLDFAAWFATEMNGLGIRISVNPEAEEIASVFDTAKNATAVVVGTYNGHLNRGQLDLCNEAIAHFAGRGVPVVAVALRNPYDLSHVGAATAKLAAYEYSENSFFALQAAFEGEYIPTGRLSVVL